jgi:NAD(P)-dependent dehydrogenase (short-subunit alcohol dehydrogenase family)
MSKFTGRVAVVTGAGSGIGRALALELARRGAKLALSDIDEASARETAKLAEALGAETHADQLDVSDRAAFLAYAEHVAGHFGAVNQIYNNAGIAFSRTVAESELSDYDRVLGINLFGVIVGTKAFLPHLLASGDGHVINISSLNGIMPQPELSAYCTAKFGVRGFTETLRMEMLAAKAPVRVTVVHPGGVKTNIASKAAAAERAAGNEPTQRELDQQKLYEEKLLVMPPEKAAEIILDAVAKDRGRVIVGNDAKVVDVLVRAMPGKFQKAALKYMERAFKVR